MSPDCHSDISLLLEATPHSEPDLITEEEIACIIASLPPGKAAGHDHVCNEHLKFAPPVIASILTTIFNSILLSGHVPTSFQHGLIVPIPKGRNIDTTNPSNFRGITLLPVISEVLEKLLLTRLSSQTSKIHPLQGGFRPKTSCMHTAFILQEAIHHLRSKKRKAFTAYLDVKKAFDTVWHDGLFQKLLLFGFPRYIWSILRDWYSCSTSAVLWNSSISRSFPIRQGVRQGAVLSPLLYSIFVNDLLLHLSSSGHGVSINGIFCGSPMFADDLALVSESDSDLQSMLNIVTHYATTWRYKLNASKSSILVIGESNRSRTQNRQTRSWHVCGDPLPEKDTQHHLGILRSVSPSTAQRTSERCSAGRSAFFGLNAIGSRFGCLHPVTILRLYKVYCLPVLLYGCELWSVTQTEILMLERVHRKILRTILNLPIRCPSRSLLSITGMLSISAMIHHKQLNFLHSFSLLPADSLPRQLFQALTTSISPNYTTSKLQTLLHQHCLPPITAIPSLQLSKRCWKQAMKRILWAAQLADFLVSCSHLPLAQCSVLHRGKPIPHLLICRGFPKTTKRNNTRIRLLVNCHGLETDTCRFRTSPQDDTCRLCRTAREDALHFISHCPALSSARDPSRLSALAPLLTSDPLKFTEHILGTSEWIDDPPLQREIVEFVYRLHTERLLKLSLPTQ